MPTSMLVGVFAALLAAFIWSLNFIVPFVIGPFSVFDFALIRFVAAGLLCAAFLLSKMDALRSLTLQDWMLTVCLGLIGYLGYFLALVGAAVYAGPVIAPAILGLVPIVLGIAGNLRRRIVPWRALAMPLGLAFIGLLLVNVNSSDDAGSARSVPEGVAFAVAAVALWTWFGLLNQSTLARRPAMDASVWTALIMTGAGVGMLAFAPVGFYLGVFRTSQLGFGWSIAAPLYIWGVTLGVSGSIGGALAWTVAAQRIPVSLAAQLVVMEAVFGAIVGLIVHKRWPTATEVAGMTVLIAGVVAGVRAFNTRRNPLPAT
jgi:drug/metabolite transporter (DMT)-like permease